MNWDVFCFAVVVAAGVFGVALIVLALNDEKDVQPDLRPDPMLYAHYRIDNKGVFIVDPPLDPRPTPPPAPPTEPQ